jgi:hypothetical protein
MDRHAASRPSHARGRRPRVDGFPGSERDPHRIGLPDGGALAPLKARVLLTFVLWSEPDRAAAEARFRLDAH